MVNFATPIASTSELELEPKRPQHWISPRRCIYQQQNRWRLRMRLWGKLIDLGFFKTRQEAIEVRNATWAWYFGFDWLRIVATNANKSRIHDADGVGLYFDRESRQWIVWPGDRDKPLGKFARRKDAIERMLGWLIRSQSRGVVEVPEPVANRLISDAVA